MGLDRQSIERRDFPIGRRGYDAAAVDAHLRALAVEVEELRRTAATGSPDVSLASSAGTQVQSIIGAAEAAAADIERQAAESARQLREAAERDAQRTREEAIERARTHVAAVSQISATLLEHASGMDAEVLALSESVRAAAGRLAADLAAVEANMAALHDAAGIPASVPAPAVASTPPRVEPAPLPAEQDPAPAERPAAAEQAPAPAPPAGGFEAELAGAIASSGPPAAAPPQPAPPSGQAGGQGADLDGARLIALNMALNGEPREETERYLAENFALPDREKLVDEVYAAIEA